MTVICSPTLVTVEKSGSWHCGTTTTTCTTLLLIILPTSIYQSLIDPITIGQKSIIKKFAQHFMECKNECKSLFLIFCLVHGLFLLKEVDSVFMLLSAVLHIGDLRFTALTDADTAFPSDLQLLERGQCPCYMTLVACVEEVRGGGLHLVYIVVIAPPSLSPLEFCLAACQRELKVRQSPV